MIPKIMGRVSDLRSEIRDRSDYSWQETKVNSNWAVCSYKCVHGLNEVYLEYTNVAVLVIQQKLEEIETLQQTLTT